MIGLMEKESIVELISPGMENENPRRMITVRTIQSNASMCHRAATSRKQLQSLHLN